jgi:hypothetical protein
MRPHFVSAILLSFVVGAAAQEPKGKQASPPLNLPSAAEQEAFANGKRRVAFPKRKMSWSEAIEWLVDESGLPYVAGDMPTTDAFEFKGPAGAKFTFTEVVDILNESLLPVQFLLIRRWNAFTIVTSRDRIDPIGMRIQRIVVDELDKRGKTEVVQIVMAVRYLNLDEIAPLIKKR